MVLRKNSFCDNPQHPSLGACARGVCARAVGVNGFAVTRHGGRLGSVELGEVDERDDDAHGLGGLLVGVLAGSRAPMRGMNGLGRPSWHRVGHLSLDPGPCVSELGTLEVTPRRRNPLF